MNRNSKRRNSSVEHRSTKRRKRESEDLPIYSTRIITWEEQLTLPPRFHEEKNVWPALKILEERGVGKRREYLLEWEPHPTTREIFEPTWEPAENVGQELKQEWNKILGTRQSPSSPQDISTTAQPRPSRSLINRRRPNNRRIIPDSSAEIDEVVIDNSASSRTPTLTGSPDSADSTSSPIEISETQHSRNLPPVRVIVPPAPTDKSEWESLRDSQFSNLEPASNSTSPAVNSVVPGSSISRRTPSHQEDTTTPASLLDSSIRSSLRFRTTAQRDRGQNIGRILDYQPATRDQTSPIDSSHFHTGPLERGDPTVVVNNSSPHANLARPRTTEPSVHLSGSRSGEQDFQTPPWVFESQIPLQTSSTPAHRRESQGVRGTLSGRCARKTSHPVSQDLLLPLSNSRTSSLSNSKRSQTGMAARGTRQSPRLQTAFPHSDAPPRIAVRTGTGHRARSSFNPPEHSSPLAASAELAESAQMSVLQNNSDSSFLNNLSTQQTSSVMSVIPPSEIAPNEMHIDPSDPSLIGSLSQDSISYDAGLNTLPTPVQESIEESAMSSTEDTSSASKASSSQEFLHNERPVPQVDGLVMPTYPILGPDEYVIALPAEGKVQAIYNQTIKVKRRAILKFVRRRGSVNVAGTSANKTHERNEMIELIDRLHDTTTHIDLGLPGIPTQFTIPSQEHATYAEYAGSKFVFLGQLLDFFKRHPQPIVIMAKSGGTQNLIQEYLHMKRVKVNRYEQNSFEPPVVEEDDVPFSPTVELLSTRANSVVKLSEKPSIIIAFDASFDSQDPQLKSLRAELTEPIPVVHLLVTNSSEHVERCLPISMPSPIRLRLLVRATYQAHLNLGGSPTIITNAFDNLDGRPMDLADISKAVRKSPNRKLQMVASVVAHAALSDDFASNWTLNGMPELALDELDDSPFSGSTVSATPARSRNRSQTPISRTAGQVRTRSRTPVSRAGTPSARKRQLEIDTSIMSSKRQRMTPVNDLPDGAAFVAALDNDHSMAREQELQHLVNTLRVELANERKARQDAEEATMAAERKAAGWQLSLSALQHRYEKRTKKSHQQQQANKSLTTAIENTKQRMEKINTENVSLRQQNQQLKKDLETARNDLKSAGGDIAALEVVREEARDAVTKATTLDKSLENSKRDFEFLRSQYQTASNKAAELGNQVISLETQVTDLTHKASDEKRRLKELNFQETAKQHLAKINQLESEKRSIQVLYKKLEDESKMLKRNRGVQTRGSSTAPGSPGQRSRQGSPAAGNVPPTGSRASALRHER